MRLVLLSTFIIYELAVESTNFHYSMIKEIEGIFYVGGRNYLSSYKLQDNRIEWIITNQTYGSIFNVMNGSDVGYTFESPDFPLEIDGNLSSLAFDTCLNWKQNHPNDSYRNRAFDYQHRFYHTPSGDWNTTNFICMNSFIRNIEIMDNDTFWVCGTFGSFPRAFIVDKTSLNFIKFADVNLMSCARYVDEPMVAYRDSSNSLYVASGWGLYKPDKKNPDVPNNNSTILYSDWRLFRNLFTLPAAMALVLSSDVNFINVVEETKTHLYFFGYEINNQYGLNNQEDRHAWQSFMLRICKNDLGFKYVPTDISSILKHMTNPRYYNIHIPSGEYLVSAIHEDISLNDKWYKDSAHLPTKHFANPQKINFGCYIGRRPRAISDNYFWGETNVVYLNKLADVKFDPNRKIKFRTKSNHEYFGCINENHEQLPLIGIFNSPGIQGTAMTPTGALCQLQINANIFNEIGSKKSPYHKSNMLNVANAYEELMLLNSVSVSNFYSRSLHRTNGLTLYPFWNQGVLIGRHDDRPYYRNVFDDIGKCHNSSFYEKMDKNKFLKLQNFSNTAWPNELPNRLSSIPSAICQYSAAELYGFNASFVLPGVEFKKMFVLAENITNYHMHKSSNDNKEAIRRSMSPLMIVSIFSTKGYFYRIVLCDLDNGMNNHGEDKTLAEWYNWCIFRHTDQPYLYRQYAPMENRKREESYQYRASSLLLSKKIIHDRDELSYPINRDPQFHIIKDVSKKDKHYHVLTSENIYIMNSEVNCTANYTTCIDCASDPECMWTNDTNKCVRYDENNYDGSNFVQDVLDRGFKCLQFVNRTSKTIYDCNNNIHKTLFCNNSGYWRGSIQWIINNSTIVNTDSNQFSINPRDNSLILINCEFIRNVSCYGIKDDHDKLYNNMEYNWINQNYDKVLLFSYIFETSPNYCLGIKIMIIIIILLLFTLISFPCLKSCKQSKNKNTNLELKEHNSENSSSFNNNKSAAAKIHKIDLHLVLLVLCELLAIGSLSLIWTHCYWTTR